MTRAQHAVFVDPSSDHFLEDRLFDTTNPTLNRDGTLLPFGRLRTHLNALGIPVHTADRLRNGSVRADVNHYWSLGLLNGHQDLIGREDVRLRGFVLLEPPLVAPHMYRALPTLTRNFEKVYLHNTYGDGYTIEGVARRRLEKLHWPQPYADTVDPQWSRQDRLNKLVVIAGLHNPRHRKPEFYSKRIEGVAALHALQAVDLYGRGWDRWWTRQAASPAYWRYRAAIKATYRGSCSSKMDTLSQYRFSLCFENMPMLGYVTEKIFDCLYAGTVPVYLGAQDIADLIPSDAYIDMRDFGSGDYASMWRSVSAMSDSEWQRRRKVGREFIRGVGKNLYHDSLVNMMGQCDVVVPESVG